MHTKFAFVRDGQILRTFRQKPEVVAKMVKDGVRIMPVERVPFSVPDGKVQTSWKMEVGENSVSEVPVFADETPEARKCRIENELHSAGCGLEEWLTAMADGRTALANSITAERRTRKGLTHDTIEK
jgi:hypothetical protein